VYFFVVVCSYGSFSVELLYTICIFRSIFHSHSKKVKD
jgi:hypothetical protein